MLLAALLAAGCGTDPAPRENPVPAVGTGDPVLDEPSGIEASDGGEPSDGQTEPGAASNDDERSDANEPSAEVETAGSEGAGENAEADSGAEDATSDGVPAEDPPSGIFDDSQVFADVDCPEWLEGLGLACSLATVPIDRSDPSAGTIDISVAVLPGRGDGSLPAMAVLQGGPGGASSEMAAYLPTRPYPQVFIDQRGTGFGSADFRCPEVFNALPGLLEATRGDARPIELDAYRRCVDRLADHPALAHTTTAAHADDVAEVMEGLGHDRWLVYGVSYGTTIALEVLRDAPATLAGAVLDGVYPPTLDLNRDVALAARRAMGELDQACAADPVCVAILAQAPSGDGATVSGLVSVLIAEFNAEPLKVSIGDFETSLGEALDVLLDGDSVASVLHEILYIEDWIGLLPALVAGLANGDERSAQVLTVLGVELSAFSLGSSALGTHFAVTCADRLPFTSDPPAAEDVGPFGAAVIGEGIGTGCELWPVAPSPASAADPVASELPVLLLSGRFDPITPPDFAEAAAEHLPKATLVVRDGASHGTWGFDSCVNRIVDDFVADPDTPLDTECASAERPVQWRRVG